MRRAILCVAVLTCGCGTGKYPVAGSVKYSDGTPVRSGRVVAEQEGVDGATGGWGVIGEDGTFRLGSLTPTDGLEPGTYRVWLDGTDFRADGERTAAVVDPRFGDPTTSGFLFAVPEQTHWTLTVERPGASKSRP